MRSFLKQIIQATRWFDFIQLKHNNKYKHHNIDWLCISKYIQGDELKNSTSFQHSYYKAKHIKLLLEKLPTVDFFQSTYPKVYGPL